MEHAIPLLTSIVQRAVRSGQWREVFAAAQDYAKTLPPGDDIAALAYLCEIKLATRVTNAKSD
jgi:hypothetical protein